MKVILGIAWILTITSIKSIDCKVKVIANENFNEECLISHNEKRRLHVGTNDLRLNRTLTEFAVSRIKYLTKTSMVSPVNAMPYGENYFWFYERKQSNTGFRSCRDAVNMWYDGLKHYAFNSPGFKKESGGFSQLVWRNTKSVGCAMVHDEDKDPLYYQTFLVCNYWPPGNVDKEYHSNVLPLKTNDDYDHSQETWNDNRPNGNQRPPVRPPTTEGSRPGTGGGNRPVLGGNRPVGGGNRPIDSWENQKPGSTDNMWPGSVDRPGNRPNTGMGPVPPNYPYPLLQPMI